MVSGGMVETAHGTEAGRRRLRSPGRALRWCIARTELDRRRAVNKGRPITTPNLRRLLSRRVWAAGDAGK